MTEEMFREPTPEELAERESYEAGAYDRAVAETEQQRQAAYQTEADPLFFKYQREEVSKDEWLAKIEEIKARYPLPEPPVQKDK